MLRLGARASMGCFVDTYVYVYYFVFFLEYYVNLAGAVDFNSSRMNHGLLVLWLYV